MNKLYFYKFSTLGLLILNIVLITFMIINRPPKKPKHGSPSGRDFKTEVIQTLHMDDEQTARFHQLANNHNLQIQEIQKRQQDLLNPYFERLIKSSMDTSYDVSLDQFLILEKEKIQVTYQHFEQIRELLRGDQQTHYKDFMRKMIDVLVMHDKKTHHHQRISNNGLSKEILYKSKKQ